MSPSFSRCPTFSLSPSLPCVNYGLLNIFPKSQLLPYVSDGLHFSKKSINFMCLLKDFIMYFSKKSITSLSMMDTLNIFPKSPLLPCVSDGLLKLFSRKSININMDLFHVSVMDFLNISPKSPSLPCVSDGLFEDFPKKSITLMCQ